MKRVTFVKIKYVYRNFIDKKKKKNINVDDSTRLKNSIHEHVYKSS